MIDLNPYQSEIKKLCQVLAVKRLDLVGSAARDDFRPEASDIDVVIEFQGDEGLFRRYFQLKHGLEKIFGKKVDVLQEEAIKNPYLRESLEEDRTLVYEA
jgi:predicted nucleotidyltransferase